MAHGAVLPALPPNRVVYQSFLFMDAGAFLGYNANMRAAAVGKLQACGTVVFNRAGEKRGKPAFRKIVRGLNRRCAMVFEWADGPMEYDEIRDPFPLT